MVERDLAARTWELYRNLLDRLIMPTFGEMAVEDIRVRHVKAWYAQLCPNRPTQRAHAYGLLRTILTEAVREELLQVNPANIRRASSVKRARTVRLLTDDELTAAVAALDDPVTRLMIRTMAECALRFGEAAELRREDVLNPAVGDVRIHVQRSVATVRGENQVKAPKSAAGVRVVPVHRSISDELLAHALTLAPGALLFPGRDGQHFSHSVLHKLWKAAQAKAGVEPVRLHDLRHRGGMAIVRAGASQKATMRFMGHSSSAAHAVYLHANDDELRRLVDSR
jgi:integrase